MPVADTTTLVAVLDETHPRHADARTRLQGVATLHIPTVILSELSVVLRRLAKDHGHDGNRYARRVVTGLLDKPEVHECQQHDGAQARQLYVRNPKLSYADSVAIVTAWGLPDDLVTFDNDQFEVWTSGVP